jgi:thiamine pyrophosphokinase
LNIVLIKSKTVLIVGAFGGRFDQEMASIHALFKWYVTYLLTCHRMTHYSLSLLCRDPFFYRIVLLGQPSIAFLLSPGKHRIEPLEFESTAGNHCGLIPVDGPCRSVTTTGLGWDLTNDTIGFGKLVSTSNFIKSDVDAVTVDTSDFLLWTASSS